MTRPRHLLALAALTSAGSVLALSTLTTPAGATAHPDANRQFLQTNLVSDIPGLAAHTDPNLRNPWGTSTGPGLPIWVSDNARGVTTLYDGAGNPQPGPKESLVVRIPAPAPAGPGTVGTPTGTAFNPSSGGFVVTKAGISGSSRFLFATEDGTLVGWNPAVDRTHAVTAVDRSGVTDPAGDVGAIYKGLALATTSAGEFLYATNFRFGQVEMFDTSFNLVKTFTDAGIPTGFAPFGIHNIGGRLFVTFAKQDIDKHDDVAGPGNGFVDVFSTNGDLLHRFASRGKLNSPWAVTLAPASFGAAAGDILVGNFGSGRIDSYTATSGEPEGQLRDASDHPITIPGLWGLRFPTGSLNAAPGALYFTAGINHEADGLLGDIVPQP
ncbi:MAG: hypothetical protein QOE89_1895 [Pseudonocardiales bacterium]|nr:hypothetical protein [Pseudonocardiales bacterium]